MKKYKFGFSPIGLFAFLLAMIPNIIWFVFPPASDPLALQSAGIAWLEGLMSFLQVLMIALLIIFVPVNPASQKVKLITGISAVVCLFIYYLLWILYFNGFSNPNVLVGLAVFPSLFFVFVCLYLNHMIALVPAVLFGFIHSGLAVMNWVIGS